MKDDHWPPPGDDLTLYLSAAGGGALTEVPPTTVTASEYDYDPADPTPTVGGRLLMPTVVAPGIQDLSEVARRDDVLTFDGDELGSPLHIAGPVRLRIWAITSAVDTDFSAVLVDIHPDGRRMLVADGFIRCRHRNGFEQEDWLTPGEPFVVEIDLWDVAWAFDSGHRVGLHLASASFPRFDRSLNVATKPGEGTLDDAAVAHQQILHDPERSSVLRLAGWNPPARARRDSQPD